MHIEELINDKSIKPKEKTELISQQLLDNTLLVNDLLDFATGKKDAIKATCIEAIEFASKQKPAIANDRVFYFVIASLADKAPRVKWESAKVIGNIAHLFPSQLESAIAGLLINSEHEGTVVRWSAAFALGEILKLKTLHNIELLPAVDAICDREEKNSIRKIYQAAAKVAKK